MKDIDGRREYIGQREYHSRSFGHRSTHLQATVFSYRPKYSSTFLSLCHKPWTLISHLLLSIPIFFPAIGAILLGWFSLVELASLPMFTTSVMLYIGRSTHRTPPSTCATCFFSVMLSYLLLRTLPPRSLLPFTHRTPGQGLRARAPCTHALVGVPHAAYAPFPHPSLAPLFPPRTSHCPCDLGPAPHQKMRTTAPAPTR